ncbi:uncharacterized protein LOC126893379 [Diabrotica virgifera virgifera]|uniref:Uncharacterized protein LOC114345950 n=1 Tax=Diabrotica virgifera virgifera TaxID=50390 RepID=A0A6P7GRU7_DIAVI|nr:uncharacterized protein LOC126878800 [Diabrotica virgifera virgifera]XP_050519452.1 uncharacterized protein LOC126893379 [Diabrotica virgifera virgifera]
MKKVVMNLRKIIGSGHSWRNACYKLSSVLFTKELLTHFSWTGVSRTKNTKLPFQKLHNILGIFYHVVKYCDGSFNYAHRETFFRDGILKHANTRLNPKKKNDKENNPDQENIRRGRDDILIEDIIICNVDVNPVEEELMGDDGEQQEEEN